MSRLTATSPRRSWSRAELAAVFGLYCRTPFGRLHYRNPDIQQLARSIGRSASAVAMKACNFAALDPALGARVRGLANASRADRDFWLEFARSPERIAVEASAALERFNGLPPREEHLESWRFPSGPTEVARTVRARRVQAFFRAAVLSSYNFRCALTGIAEPELLNASHIVPWHEDEDRRADPRNGICLNALHDRAFDRGWISFDETLHVIVSPKLQRSKLGEFGCRVLREVQGKAIAPPERFLPDPEALRWHRENRFRR